MFQDFKIAYLREHVKVKEVQQLTFLRQSVAYVLSQSARSIPHAAMVTQFDVTSLVQYGKTGDETIAKSVEKMDHQTLLKRAVHRNFSAFFIKAMAHALHHVPCMNGFLDYTPWRNGGTMYIAEDINVSFTVHTKFGVIKPIVRNPHKKDITTVASEMRVLTRRARRTDVNELYQRMANAYIKTALKQLDLSSLQALWIFLRSRLWRREKPDPAFADVPEEDKLQVGDILGATITIANIGMMLPGNQTVTVIIPPEVMMFGIGDLHLAPKVVDGEVVPRYVITMTGTMDHRAFDAGEAFPIYQHLKRYFDNPELIFEWKEGDPF
jgi:pyruvate/2-oxoglutarate dehydrogenase complex dihydrolipoamide acyltransferase (E2) component